MTDEPWELHFLWKPKRIKGDVFWLHYVERKLTRKGYIYREVGDE